MKNNNKATPILLIISILVVFVILFGCTSTGSKQNTGEPSIVKQEEEPHDFNSSLNAALKDPTKYIFYFSVERGGPLFNATLYFISESDTKKYDVPGYLLMNKSEICDENIDKYNKFLVTFKDSPAGETWDWNFTGYCNYSDYNPWLTTDQMQGIKNPENPKLTKAFAEITLDPSKYLFYLQIFEGKNATGMFNGTVYFISNTSDNDTKKYHISNIALLNRSDICNGAKEKYNKLTVVYDDSPLGQNDSWIDQKYCNGNSYYLWNTPEKLEEMKNPSFEITIFERPDNQGPIDGNLTCNGQPLGTLVNGRLNTTKLALLDKVHGNCTLSLRGEYNGIAFEECGWTLTEQQIKDYASAGYMLGESRTLALDIRHAPCSTKESYVTPNDPAVQSRLNVYQGSSTRDTFRDVGHIFNDLSDDFKYMTDQNQFNQEDWYQLPSEFFKTNTGDCEDWSVAFLSLILARGPAPCWAVYIEYLYPNMSVAEGGHVTVLCIDSGDAKLFDQHQIYYGAVAWDDLKKGLDYDGTLTNEGVAYLKPDGYFNDTFYAEVNGTADLYQKLGIKQ